MSKVVKRADADGDAPLKIEGMSFLWRMGCVVRPEVLLSEAGRTGRSKEKYLDLTDVDVLGYQFDGLLNLRTICLDCGAGSARSPMDRAFWLRGLKEAMALDQVICVVGRNIEEEHRFAALRFGVQLVHASEFSALVTAIANGLPMYDFSSYYAENDAWAGYTKNIPGTLHDFLLKDNWQRDWNRIPVTVPGQLRRWGANLDLSKPLHQHGLIELGLLLSVGLTKLAVQLFKSKPGDLRSAVRTAVLGGDRQSRVIDQMIRLLDDIQASKEVKSSLFANGNRFEVPYLTELIDLLFRFETRISKAIAVPRCIQSLQLARLSGDIARYPEFLGNEADPVTVKLALDVFRYLRVASETKADFSKLFGSV